MASPVAAAAAAAIADDEPVLPVDVLYDILLRLPAKPLCRFRAVCPSWRSLLCDPTFIAAHAARHHPGPLIAVAMEGTDKDVALLDMSGNVVKRLQSRQPSITDSMWTHHDLVFLKGKDGTRGVVDPATGTTSVLPPRPSRAARVTQMYTVGWAPAAGEYKAVTIGANDLLEEQVCMVLTLGGNKNGGWRERGSPPARVELRHGGESAVVGAVAYFLMMSDCVAGWHDWIVAFDLELEAWRPASIRGPMEPEEDPMYRSQVRLVEVNGHLVASLSRPIKPGCDACVVELWFLMDDDPDHNPVWSKQYAITLPTTRDCYKYIDKPLHVLEDGRIVVWIWDGTAHADYGVPRVYDPTTETFTDGAVTTGRPRAVGGVYTGSLLRTVGVSVSQPRRNRKPNPRFHGPDWHSTAPRKRRRF